MVNLAVVVEEIDLTIWGEFHCSFINQILDLVLQRPAVVCVMSRTNQSGMHTFYWDDK